MQQFILVLSLSYFFRPPIVVFRRSAHVGSTLMPLSWSLSFCWCHFFTYLSLSHGGYPCSCWQLGSAFAHNASLYHREPNLTYFPIFSCWYCNRLGTKVLQHFWCLYQYLLCIFVLLDSRVYRKWGERDGPWYAIKVCGQAGLESVTLHVVSWTPRRQEPLLYMHLF